MAAGQMTLTAAVLLTAVACVAATFTGDGTYYGDNGWAGYCAGNMPWANKPWPPPDGQYGVRVALNQPQAGPHGGTDFCGRKIMFRGTGSGSGGSPISSSWQRGMVTNVCPECKYGDLDMGIGGDGRWGIEWYWVDEGAGSNTVEAASKGRALVPQKKPAPKKATPRRTPKRTPKPTPKPTRRPLTRAQKKARTSYIFATLQAKKWLKVMQSHAKSSSVYKNALRMRRLYNTRATKYKKVMLGRKLLR